MMIKVVPECNIYEQIYSVFNTSVYSTDYYHYSMLIYHVDMMTLLNGVD